MNIDCKIKKHQSDKIDAFSVAQTEQISKHFLEDLVQLTVINNDDN